GTWHMAHGTWHMAHGTWHMAQIALLLFALFSSDADSSTPADGHHVETMTVPRFGLLTRLWAQEAIGAPEAHALLAKLAANKFEFYFPRIAIFTERVGLSEAFKNVRISEELGQELAEEAQGSIVDMNQHADDLHGDEFAEAFEDYHRISSGDGRTHIAAVANLLASDSPVGISKYGVIAAIANLEYEDVDEGVRIYLSQNTEAYVDIIHFSVFLQKPYEYQAIADLSEQYGKFLLIASAGNSFPDEVFGDNAISDISVISVGSCNPAGSPSHFSQCGRLNILAPSDDYIQTHTEDSTTLATFSGTSGASPLVSGAVADFLAILPSKQIAYPQLTKLLQATAIPVAVDPKIDGDVRVLNYYKLLRVALRIRHAIADDLDSAKIRTMIADPATYDFSAEAVEAKQLALKSVGKEHFQLLRQAFFLNPEDREIRNLLSSFYRSHGFKAQAIYYSNPVQALEELLTIDAHKYRQHLKSLYDAKIFADGKLTSEYKNFMLAAVKLNSSDILAHTLDRISSHPDDQLKSKLDLLAVIGINPAELAVDKPKLFKMFKRHQAKLLAR
ncbi:MAG: S8/S53 family peptidase, partial [Pseudomonadota bacterium]|nr:S8/S53 family peptidase [Pseudomonadota bacterium]